MLCSQQKAVQHLHVPVAGIAVKLPGVGLQGYGGRSKECVDGLCAGRRAWHHLCRISAFTPLPSSNWGTIVVCAPFWGRGMRPSGPCTSVMVSMLPSRMCIRTPLGFGGLQWHGLLHARSYCAVSHSHPPPLITLQVLPELQDRQVNERPILKAGASCARAVGMCLCIC